MVPKVVWVKCSSPVVKKWTDSKLSPAWTKAIASPITLPIVMPSLISACTTPPPPARPSAPPSLDHTDGPFAKRSSLRRAIKSAKVRVGLYGSKLLKCGGKGGLQKGHRPPQKGHRSAGGANVLKLVARGPGPKLLKFGGPLMSRHPPVVAGRGARETRAAHPAAPARV